MTNIVQRERGLEFWFTGSIWPNAGKLNRCNGSPSWWYSQIAEERGVSSAVSYMLEAQRYDDDWVEMRLC